MQFCVFGGGGCVSLSLSLSLLETKYSNILTKCTTHMKIYVKCKSVFKLFSPIIFFLRYSQVGWHFYKYIIDNKMFFKYTSVTDKCVNLSFC
jgi:hypothetical protein